MNQNKLTEYFGKEVSENSPPADKHSLLSRRLVLLCVRSLISYNCVTSEGFTDFFKSYDIILDFDGPHRTTLTRTALDDVHRDATLITLLHFGLGEQKQMIVLGTVLNSLSESVSENFVAPTIIFILPSTLRSAYIYHPS